MSSGKPESAVAQWQGEDAVHLSGVIRGEGWWQALEVSGRAAESKRAVELYCEDGVAVLGGGWDEHVTVYREGAQGIVDERIQTPGELPLLAELRAFVEHRRGGPPPRSSAAEGAAIVSAIGELRALARARMIDATILIPTFRHAALLPFTMRSALDQADASVEVFVVGDGVEDDTRAALEPFADDERVRFFDFPKGARHGELNRHEALREATGEIVCYLSDDDLLLRDHVAEMAAPARERRLRTLGLGAARRRRDARVLPLEHVPA